MSAVFVSGSSAAASSSAASVTVAAPASIIAGNLLVAIVYSANESTTPCAAPSGWATAGLSTPDYNPGNMGVFTKVATASEPSSYTFTGQDYLAADVLLFSGVTGIDGSAAFNAQSTSATACTAPSATTTAPGDMLVVAFGSYNGNTFSTPSGMTAGPAAVAGGTESVCSFYETLSASGATGTISSTQSSSSQYTGMSLLLLAASTPTSQPVSGSVSGVSAVSASTAETVPPNAVLVASSVPGINAPNPASPTLPGAPLTVGDWLIMEAVVTGGTTSSVTGYGVYWSLLDRATASDGTYCMEVWHGQINAGAPGGSIVFSGTGTVSANMEEWSGLAGVENYAADSFPSASGYAAGAVVDISGRSITPSKPADLFISAAAVAGQQYQSAFAPYVQGSDGSNYLIATDAAAHQPTYTITANGNGVTPEAVIVVGAWTTITRTPVAASIAGTSTVSGAATAQAARLSSISAVAASIAVKVAFGGATSSTSSVTATINPGYPAPSPAPARVSPLPQTQYMVALANNAFDDPTRIVFHAVAAGGLPNLLSTADASFTGTPTWSAVSNVASMSVVGGRLRVVAAAAGTSGAVEITTAATYPVIPGLAYDAMALLQAATSTQTPATGYAAVSFYNSSGTLLEGPAALGPVTEPAQSETGGVVAPAGAAFASVQVIWPTADGLSHDVLLAGLYLVAGANYTTAGSLTQPGPYSGPGATTTSNVWTDVTPWIEGHALSRGRQHELDQFQAGTLTLDAQNTQGVFNRWNISGPLYPGLNIRRPIRYRAMAETGWVNRFTGVITSVDPTWPDPLSGHVQIHASDVMRLLNTAELSVNQYAATVIKDGATCLYRLGDPAAPFVETLGGPSATATGTPTFASSQPFATDATPGVSLGGTGGGQVSIPAQFSFAPTINSGPGSGFDLWVKGSGQFYSAGGLVITVGSTGVVTVTLSGTAVLTTAAGVVPQDSHWHYIGVSYAYAEDGTGRNETTLIVDNDNNVGSWTGGPTSGVVTLGPPSGSSMEVANYAFYPTTELVDPYTDYNSPRGNLGVGHYLTGTKCTLQELSGARIGEVLDAVGWPTAARAIDAGALEIQAETSSLTQTFALAHIQQVEQAEAGAFFVDGDGTITFLDQTVLAAIPAPTVTFGDDVVITAVSLPSGTGAGQQTTEGPAVTVQAGQTYTMSAPIDATYTSGNGELQVFDQTGTAQAVGYVTGGTTGTATVTLTVPSGVTSLRVGLTQSGTITAGHAITFSQPTMTKSGSTHNLLPLLNDQEAWGVPAEWTSNGEIPYQPGVAISADDQLTYNIAKVSRSGGATQVALDRASVDQYGPQTYTLTGLILANDVDALSRANLAVTTYSQPFDRVGSISVQLTDLCLVPSQTATMLTMELLDSVTVNRHTLDYTEAGYVEQISENVTPDSWLITLGISPVAS